MSEPMKVKVEIEVQEIADEIIRKLTEDGTLVEVVRCKDCRFWERGHSYCPDNMKRTEAYWFCAGGERKDDE